MSILEKLLFRSTLPHPPLALLHSLLVLILAAVVAASAGSSQAMPGCNESCWNLASIPYPFGIGPHCYRDEDFKITCNDTVQKAFMGESNIDVTSISLEDAELNVMQYIAYDYYDSTGFVDGSTASITGLSFMVSTKNEFTAIGCDTDARITGNGGEFLTGCISVCDSDTYITDGSCSGIGCCRTAIPKGLWSYEVELDSFYNHTNISNFNPCSYAFVAQKETFNFSLDSFATLAKVIELPVVLDWAIGNVTCDEAKNSIDHASNTGYACKENSKCEEAKNGPGYRCSCLEGYQGNPYLPDGCKDINECLDPSLNTCEIPEHCFNTIGSHSCPCPKGYHGNGTRDGKGCTRDQLQVILISTSTAGGITIIFLVLSCLYFGLKKRKLLRLKEKFFLQNGGIMLQQKLSGQHGNNETGRIFSKEELERATNNYAESRIVGKGGFGTVYKGILTDKRVVAIKKSKVLDQNQVEQFINEVVVLSNINHRNVVKLLGCCLETQVPLLVYEFINNGTLHDHIHNQTKAMQLSWKFRLKIAAETAGVLSYLHSAANIPIIHRDMKPMNILLDNDYTAKVSDFGTSRLVPLDQNELNTIVQGTLGYMDPEYFHTSQLTEKSDVYSFGVVLVELLTGKKALCFDRPEKERSLSVCFLSAMNESRLFEVVDHLLVLEENGRDHVMDVAKLATRCLRVKGEERPSMKEVAMELEGIMRSTMEKHPWENIDLNLEENKYLLGENSSDFGHGGNSLSVAGYDSMRQQIVFPLGSGR